MTTLYALYFENLLVVADCRDAIVYWYSLRPRRTSSRDQKYTGSLVLPDLADCLVVWSRVEYKVL